MSVGRPFLEVLVPNPSEPLLTGLSSCGSSKDVPLSMSGEIGDRHRGNPGEGRWQHSLGDSGGLLLAGRAGLLGVKDRLVGR